MGQSSLLHDWLAQHPTVGTPAAWDTSHTETQPILPHPADEPESGLAEASSQPSTALVPLRPTAMALTLPSARIRAGELQTPSGHIIRSAAVRLAPILLPPPPPTQPKRPTLKYWTRGLLATSAIGVVATMAGLFSNDLRAIFSNSAAPVVKTVRTIAIKPEVPIITTSTTPDGAMQTQIRLPENTTGEQERAIIQGVTQARIARHLLKQKMSDEAMTKGDTVQIEKITAFHARLNKTPDGATPEKSRPAIARAPKQPLVSTERRRTTPAVRADHSAAAAGKPRTLSAPKTAEPVKKDDGNAVTRFFKDIGQKLSQ